MRTPRSEYPSEQADKFLLRLPDGMRDRLKAEAEANKRSMNAEIVARLELSFDAPKLFGDVDKGSLNDFEKFSRAMLDAIRVARREGREITIKYDFDAKADNAEN